MFNRNLVKGISLCLMLAILVSLIVGCSSSKYITGNELLIKQESCLNDLKSYADGVDEVYTLYFIGSISPDDFLAELSLLKEQYTILQGLYARFEADNPVIEEGHSYASKRGTEAIKNAYTTVGEILKYSIDENGQPVDQDELAYTYLAFKQQLADEIAEYVTAVAWLKDANGEFNEVKTENGSETETEKTSD